MARLLTCDIVTPEKLVFTSEAKFVTVPATEGEVGILPEHVPLVSTLKNGEVRVTKEDDSVIHFAVSGGYVQVNSSDDKVIVLADHAIDVEEIDHDFVEGEVGRLNIKLDEILRANPDSSDKPFIEREIAWDKTQAELSAKKA